MSRLSRRLDLIERGGNAKGPTQLVYVMPGQSDSDAERAKFGGRLAPVGTRLCFVHNSPGSLPYDDNDGPIAA